MANDINTRIILAKIQELINELREEMNDNHKGLIDALVCQGVLDPTEETWTIDQTAEKMKVSRSTVNRMIKDGRLPATKMGSSQSSPVRIRPADARQAMADKQYMM